MWVGSDTLIDASVDLTTPWTSNPIPVAQVVHFSIQLQFSGAPEGTFRLRGSNDQGRPNSTDSLKGEGITNWTLINGSSQLIEEAGDHMWDAREIGYRWVQVQWLPSAGTGTLNSARFSTKGG